MSKVLDRTVSETEEHAMKRLLAKARSEGIHLGRDERCNYWASSTSRQGHWYEVTGVSCTCPGFQGHQRCKHLAALHAHLGWILEDAPVDPTPTTSPIVELKHLPGEWIDDELTPAGMLRYRKAITSLYEDGVELIRVTGDDQVSAVYKPGTEGAFDVQTCGSHYGTVVAWIRALAPEANVEQLLGKADLWRADEFLEETALVA